MFVFLGASQIQPTDSNLTLRDKRLLWMFSIAFFLSRKVQTRCTHLLCDESVKGLDIGELLFDPTCVFVFERFGASAVYSREIRISREITASGANGHRRKLNVDK